MLQDQDINQLADESAIEEPQRQEPPNKTPRMELTATATANEGQDNLPVNKVHQGAITESLGVPTIAINVMDIQLEIPLDAATLPVAVLEDGTNSRITTPTASNNANCTRFPKASYIGFEKAIGVNPAVGNHGETIMPTCQAFTVGKAGRATPLWEVISYPNLGSDAVELGDKNNRHYVVDEVRILKSTPYALSSQTISVASQDISGSVLVAAAFAPGQLRDIWIQGQVEQPLPDKMPKCRRYAEALLQASLNAENRHHTLEAADWCPFVYMGQFVNMIQALLSSNQSASVDSSGYIGYIGQYHIQELISTMDLPRHIIQRDNRTVTFNAGMDATRDEPKCMMYHYRSTGWYNSDCVRDAASGRLAILDCTNMNMRQIMCYVWLYTRRKNPSHIRGNTTPYVEVEYPGAGWDSTKLYSPNSYVYPRQYRPPNGTDGGDVPNTIQAQASMGELLIIVGDGGWNALTQYHGGGPAFTPLNLKTAPAGGILPLPTQHIAPPYPYGAYDDPNSAEGMRCCVWDDDPAFRTLNIIREVMQIAAGQSGHMESIFLGSTGSRLRNCCEMIRTVDPETNGDCVLPLNSGGFSGITHKQRFSHVPTIAALMNKLFWSSDNFLQENVARSTVATRVASGVALTTAATIVAGTATVPLGPYDQATRGAVVSDLARAVVLAGRDDIQSLRVGTPQGVGFNRNGYNVYSSSLYKSWVEELSSSQIDSIVLESEFKLLVAHGLGSVRNVYNITLRMLNTQNTELSRISALPLGVRLHQRVAAHYWNKLYVDPAITYTTNVVFDEGIDMIRSLYGLNLPTTRDLVQSMGMCHETFSLPPAFDDLSLLEAHCLSDDIYMTVGAASQVNCLQMLPNWEGLPVDGIVYELSDYAHHSQLAAADYDSEISGDCYTSAGKLMTPALLPSLFQTGAEVSRTMDTQAGESMKKDPFQVQFVTLMLQTGFIRADAQSLRVVFSGNHRTPRVIQALVPDDDFGTYDVRGGGGFSAPNRAPPGAYVHQSANRQVQVSKLIPNSRTLKTYCAIRDQLFSLVVPFEQGNESQRLHLHPVIKLPKVRMGPEIRVAAQGNVVPGILGAAALAIGGAGTKRRASAFAPADGMMAMNAGNLVGTAIQTVLNSLRVANRAGISLVEVVESDFDVVTDTITSSDALELNF